MRKHKDTYARGERMKISFKAQPWKQGGSYVVTIPADYVSQGLIQTDRELQFTVDSIDK